MVGAVVDNDAVLALACARYRSSRWRWSTCRPVCRSDRVATITPSFCTRAFSSPSVVNWVRNYYRTYNVTFPELGR